MDSERSNAIKEKGAAMRRRLSDKWQDLRERMHHKHRFVVMDTDTFQEKFSIELTGVNLFTYAGISIIVLIVLTSLLIAFTPLRALVPGYIKPELKEQSIRNSQIIDSLEVIIDQHEQHIKIIQSALSGNTLSTPVEASGEEVSGEAITYRHSKADSLLRKKIEDREKKQKKSDKNKRKKK